MARIVGPVCTLIVGLQILVGVPLAVCGAFFCFTNGPITVEVHAGTNQSPQIVVSGATIPPPAQAFALAPPPNAIPVTPASAIDNPILTSRDEYGSPLAGTVLETANLEEERSTFVAALEKAAAEHASQPAPATSISPSAAPTADTAQPPAELHSAEALILQRLYEMAEIDERAGNFERADQWRALAREIRQAKQGYDAKLDSETAGGL